MIYKIDEDINYREDDGALWRTTESEVVVRLSITPARILSYLLQNKDRVIDRNELLENIWDKHGFQASNNSLSQNISVLRKTFSELGYEGELIQTIHKIGFRINMNIDIETETALSTIMQPSVIETPRDLPAEQENINDYITASKQSVPRAGYILLSLFIATSVFVTYKLGHEVTQENNHQLPYGNLYHIGNIMQCPVYTVYQNPTKMREVKLLQATELPEKKLPCVDNAFYIFQPDDNYVYSHKGRVFLSRCTFSKDQMSHILGCKDIYINENE
jgi:DNA-binding winged helix-turn-helix (wHTH) protein